MAAKQKKSSRQRESAKETSTTSSTDITGGTSNKILRMMDDGWTPKEIASRLKLTLSDIYTVLNTCWWYRLVE